MKTTILCMFTFLALTHVNASAQSDKPKKSGNEWHAAGDAIPRSKEFADRLKKELNLDEAITQKVFQTFLANTKTVDEIKLRGGSVSQVKESLVANKDQFNEKMKGILTDDQFKKYLLLKE